MEGVEHNSACPVSAGFIKRPVFTTQRPRVVSYDQLAAPHAVQSSVEPSLHGETEPEMADSHHAPVTAHEPSHRLKQCEETNEFCDGDERPTATDLPSMRSSPRSSTPVAEEHCEDDDELGMAITLRPPGPNDALTSEVPTWHPSAGDIVTEDDIKSGSDHSGPQIEMGPVLEARDLDIPDSELPPIISGDPSDQKLPPTKRGALFSGIRPVAAEPGDIESNGLPDNMYSRTASGSFPLIPKLNAPPKIPVTHPKKPPPRKNKT